MAIRFLVADDSTFLRQALKLILENQEPLTITNRGQTTVVKRDWQVIAEAANGQEAVDKFKSARPDVVLLDISMPIMSGIEALKQILAEDHRACIVICTALGGDDDIQRAYKLGAKGYIVKPLIKEWVVSAIEQAMLR